MTSRTQTRRAKTQLECFTTVRILNPLFCSVVKETIRFHSCGRVNPSDFSDSWGMQSCPPRSHDHTKSHTATSKSHFHGVIPLEIESVRLHPHFGRREYFLCHHRATVVSRSELFTGMGRVYLKQRSIPLQDNWSRWRRWTWRVFRPSTEVGAEKEAAQEKLSVCSATEIQI